MFVEIINAARQAHLGQRRRWESDTIRVGDRLPGASVALNRQQLDRWVEAGLITPAQAVAIEQHEISRDRPRLILEVLAYVGSVLVLTAGLVFISGIWSDFSTLGQAGIASTGSAILVAVGILTTRERDTNLAVLGQTALLLSVVMFGLAVGLAVSTAAIGEVSLLLGFGSALALSAGFYVRQPSGIQNGTMFAALVGTALAITAVAVTDPSIQPPGLAISGAGAIWIILSASALSQQRRLGEALGLFALIFGSSLTVGPLDRWRAIGMLVWLAIGVGLLVYGIAEDRLILIFGGMATLIIYTPWLVTEVLDDTVGAPIALLIGGSLLVGSAVFFSKRNRPIGPTTHP